MNYRFPSYSPHILILWVTFAYASTMKATESSELMTTEGWYGGWRAFGMKVKGNTVKKKENVIQVNADWFTTTWGMGLTYTLEAPVNGRELKKVRAEIRYSGPNDIKIHAGLSTQAGGNMAQDVKLARKISEEWKVMEFPVAQMAMDFSDRFSPTFGNRNWNNVQIINLFFTKPRTIISETDMIFIRNPELIYFDPETYAKN